MSGHDTTARNLLVAVPTMLDPNFARTVVFMVEHTPDGAFGIVLNRPSETPVGDVFPEWTHRTGPPPVVFVGGPVQVGEAVIGLARMARTEPSDAWQPLLGAVGTIDLGTPDPALHPDVETVRVFAGYAGWGAGQLEDELDQGGWYVVDAEPADLLTPSPDDLWRRVLRRQGGDLAIAANQPPDPSVN